MPLCVFATGTLARLFCVPPLPPLEGWEWHAAPGALNGKQVESEITLSLHAGQEVAFRVLWTLLKPDRAGEYAIAQECAGSIAPESPAVY